MAETMTLETLLGMRGNPVIDRDGEEIGSIEEVYYDRATRLPEWIGVSTSFFGMKRVLVPTKDARIEERMVRVPFGRDRITDTPSIHDDVLTEATERRLYEHYGISYSDSASPTGLPSGVGTELTATEGGAGSHALERWTWEGTAPMQGGAGNLEREAEVDAQGVNISPDVLAPEPITEDELPQPRDAQLEPAAAAPYAYMHDPAGEAAETPEPPTPGPSTPPLHEAPPVMSDMPADVPGTLHDTSVRPRRRGRAPLVFVGGIGALLATGWLMRRLSRPRGRRQDIGRDQRAVGARTR